jgi:hypothetical protein
MPRQRPGSGLGSARLDPAGVEAAAEADLASDQLVLGAQLRERAGHAPNRGSVLAGHPELEVAERAVLGLERPLELLRFDDRVDAELVLVAAVGVLEAPFAAFEQPARPAVDQRRRRGEHQLDGGVRVEPVEQRDEGFGEGVLVVPQRLEREDVGAALLQAHYGDGPAGPARVLD